MITALLSLYDEKSETLSLLLSLSLDAGNVAAPLNLSAFLVTHVNVRLYSPFSLPRLLLSKDGFLSLDGCNKECGFGKRSTSAVAGQISLDPDQRVMGPIVVCS